MTKQELQNILEHLLSLSGENEVIEFKEAKNNFDFKELGKYFSALSNEANLKGHTHAWLFFGINNKNQIVGTQYRPSRNDLDHLKYELAEKVNNRLTFIEIYELITPQGRVLFFQIPAAPRGIPTSFGGFWYGRDGESAGPLNIQEIEQIRAQTIHSDWSALIVPNASISDLDPDAIVKARQEYIKKYPSKISDIESWNNITFLNKARLTINGNITNAALILLGKEEAHHFLSPSVAQITWILKGDDNIEKDYEHFSMPFILNSDKVLQKIRNLKYRYLPDNTLFPTEITQYEPYVIREALHNCIAHQDFTLHQRINLIEFPEHLIFENAGSFLPITIENVIEQDAPQRFYRNKFLCDAMVNLNMIDTIGSGIKKMFTYQRNRFFPLPDYDFSDPNSVKVKILGKILDKNYTQLLINNTQLDLKTIILLDRVQKNKPISEEDVRLLKAEDLIEGRKPNYFVAAHIAKVAGEKAAYIRNKAFDDKYFKDLIIEFLSKFKSGTRTDFENLLLSKMSDVLTVKQKSDKVKNILQALKKENKIRLNGKDWSLN
jgi:ATP-dependent DNA helicase RecG